MSHPVFIIDDDHAVRDALVTLLRSQGFTTRGFVSGEDFFQRIPDVAAACVVTDIRMPGMDGAELARRVGELRNCTWLVIVMTGHADVPLAVRLMKGGVIDFIEKPFDPIRLIETVRGCLGLLTDLEARRQINQATEEKMSALTQRERQVYHALIEGASSKAIALDMNVSPRTVEKFRTNVMAKMDASNLAELVRMGAGLTRS